MDLLRPEGQLKCQKSRVDWLARIAHQAMLESSPSDSGGRIEGRWLTLRVVFPPLGSPWGKDRFNWNAQSYSRSCRWKS